MISRARTGKLLSLIFVILPARAADPSPAIEELQLWVRDQGYNYTVAENWITRLSPEEQEALCGFRALEAPAEPLGGNIRASSIGPEAGNEGLGAPPSYDAMDLGYVTPIKNQLSCGSCWIFATVADLESDVAIGGSGFFDFSEQEIGDCNIWTQGGYPFCDGGLAPMAINRLTRYGAADEECHHYFAAPQSCYDCPPLKNVDNWRVITGSGGQSQISTIKNAILNYGPVFSSIYVNSAFGAYESGVYEDWSPGFANHAVQIIGWDDTKVHSQGSGAWLIKNSWGTGWGVHGPYPGCAWVAYESANLGDHTSAVAGYREAGDTIYYHDECGCGWMVWGYGDSNPTAYGAVRFIPAQDSTLRAVDFWAIDSNMSYEIKIFATRTHQGGGNYVFSNQLGSTQTGTTGERGYYSIALDTPVPLTWGDDFIVQVKLTNSSGWPIPVDYYDSDYIWWLPDWESLATFSGESYFSSNGGQFIKPSPYDIGIRARAVLRRELLQQQRRAIYQTIALRHRNKGQGGGGRAARAARPGGVKVD
jgi:C1A family cysteine protease